MKFLLRPTATILAALCLGVPQLLGADLPTQRTFTNSLGMVFVRIEAGEFMMGNEAELPAELLKAPGQTWVPKRGDYDERPAHKVRLTRPYYLGMVEVTNEQYEQYDRLHVYLRGKNGFSIDNNEAVVFVSWEDAKAFCDWLSAREGLPYRLPTEAEWEYACRAGTTTPFSTGDNLPPVFLKNPGNSWYPAPTASRGRADVVPLHVARTPANPWGLFDLHGNVEEWCLDWYGPMRRATRRIPPVAAPVISKSVAAAVTALPRFICGPPTARVRSRKAGAGSRASVWRWAIGRLLPNCRPRSPPCINNRSDKPFRARHDVRAIRASPFSRGR